MISLTAEEFALLEDEISQLRSENEYLKIAIDGMERQGPVPRGASGVRIPPHSNPYSDRVNC